MNSFTPKTESSPYSHVHHRSLKPSCVCLSLYWWHQISKQSEHITQEKYFLQRNLEEKVLTSSPYLKYNTSAGRFHQI